MQEKKGNMGLKILIFILPIVGIVLYFLWKKGRNKDAKIALKAAIYSIVFWILTCIILTVITYLLVIHWNNKKKEDCLKASGTWIDSTSTCYYSTSIK